MRYRAFACAFAFALAVPLLFPVSLAFVIALAFVRALALPLGVLISSDSKLVGIRCRQVYGHCPIITDLGLSR